MKKITAEDLMYEQRRRFLRMKQKEEGSITAAAAKASFYREPYMGIYKKQSPDKSGRERQG